MRVRDLGEDNLIKRLVPLLPKATRIEIPSGDDCAVVGLRDARVAISTDMLVEGSHFRRDWSTGYDVGWRAAMQNLADAVAMGAQPVTLVLAMQIPGDTEVAWVEDFALGCGDAARSVGCGVDGGDFTSGSQICVGVTVLGDMEGRRALTRSGARPGHALVYAGTLGISGAGLAILEAASKVEGDEISECYSYARQYCVDIFKRPMPPLIEVLEACKESASFEGKTCEKNELLALMDVSDGLVRDARRMARSSNVWIDIDSMELASDVWQLELAGFTEEEAQNLVLTGGEDHGFLGAISLDPQVSDKGFSSSNFSSPAEDSMYVRDTMVEFDAAGLPEGFRIIGRVLDTWEGGRVTLDGRDIDNSGGWDHFAR